MTKRKPIKWTEGEAKTQEEINERIAQRLMTRKHLEALMQESPYFQNHVEIISIDLDTKKE